MNKYSPLGNLAQDTCVSSFSHRSLQNMSLFYGDTSESLKNRKNFLLDLGIDYHDLVCAKQVHSGNVRYAIEDDKGKGALSYETCVPDTDAFITDRKNLPLAIFTADCLSIFLYDSRNHAIGLVHAGWRSTQECIAAKTIGLMQDKFGSRTKDIYAGFGPAIRNCCYEVGKDFEEFFPLGTIKKNGGYYLDLVEINKEQLLDSGVRRDNLFDPGICTSCQSGEFFSYRREGKDCGRMMSVMMLK